jgi:hypothetical protein
MTAQKPFAKQQAPVEGWGQLAAAHVELSPLYVPLWLVHSAWVTTAQKPFAKQQAPVGG